MADWAPRLAVVVVVAVGLLCAAALLRSRSPEGEAEPGPGRGGSLRSSVPAHAGARAPGAAADGGAASARGGVDRGRVGGAASGGTSSAEAGALPDERRRAAGGPHQAAGPQDLAAAEPAGGRLAAAGVASASGADASGGAQAERAALSAAASASGVEPEFAALRDEGDDAAGATEVMQENVDFEVEPGAYFPGDALLGFSARGGLDTAAGTVMFWVQPVDWDGSGRGSHSFFLVRDPASLDHHFSILNDQGQLRFQIVNEAGVMVSLYHPIRDWQRGEWHHVAATWGSGVMDLYADGVLVGEDYLEGIPALRADAPAFWGSNRGTLGAGAILHDARIFSQALGEADIAAVAQQPPGASAAAPH